MAIKLLRLPGDEFQARGYRSTTTPFFLLKTKKNSFSGIRVGVVVGKSVSKSAAKRNFWKRQVKEGLLKTGKAGSDVLVIISPKIGKATKKEFQEVLLKAIATI